MKANFGKGRIEGLKRWVIATTLLFIALFIVVNHEKYYNNYLFTNGNIVKGMKPDEVETYKELLSRNPDYQLTDIEAAQLGRGTNNVLPITQDAQIENKLVPEKRYLTDVFLCFRNPHPDKTNGTIVVAIKNELGKVLGETRLPTSRVRNDRTAVFSFTGKTELANSNYTVDFIAPAETNKGIQAKGENLTLVVKIEDFAGEGFGIHLSNERRSEKGNTPKLFFAQREEDVFWLQIAMYLFQVAACIALALMPREVLKKYEKKLLQILFYTTPFFCCFLLTKIMGSTIIGSLMFMFTIRGLLNILIISFFWWLFYSLTNSKRWAITLCVFLCFVLGISNYLLIEFKDSPLLAADIPNVWTGLQVARNYNFHFDKYSRAFFIYTICWLSICWTLHEEKEKLSIKTETKRLSIAFVAGAILYVLIFQSGILRANEIKISGFKPKSNYISNGCMLSFWISASMLKVEKPHGYSAEKVREITEKYKSDDAPDSVAVSEQTPNIIVVMNESYSDIRENGNIPTNKEFMPFYYNLRDNTIRGKAYSSVFGARTAPSEFEFLTGYTMRFLPYYSVPYTSLLKIDAYNYTSILKDAGYGGLIAFHPGAVNSYNRNNAYPKLGFERQVSAEDLDNPRYIRAFVSDEYDYKYVEKLYEEHKSSTDKNKPFYIFNVTIQNHGGFSDSNGVIDDGITIKEANLNYDGVRNYLNLMKLSDEALEEMIDYYSAVKEPTMIVLFGDHQPSLSDEDFYEPLSKLEGKELDEENKFIVPFMIWANYDIAEKDDELISLNYISSYISELTGGPMTGFNKYMMNLRKTLPVISERMVIDNDGNKYTLEDRNPYKDLLLEYQMLQYNGFIDNDNRIDEFYCLQISDMKP